MRPHAIDCFSTRVLNDAKERQEMGSILGELQPEYGVGQVVDLKTRAK